MKAKSRKSMLTLQLILCVTRTIEVATTVHARVIVESAGIQQDTSRGNSIPCAIWRGKDLENSVLWCITRKEWLQIVGKWQSCHRISSAPTTCLPRGFLPVIRVIASRWICRTMHWDGIVRPGWIMKVNKTTIYTLCHFIGLRLVKLGVLSSYGITNAICTIINPIPVMEEQVCVKKEEFLKWIFFKVSEV